MQTYLQSPHSTGITNVIPTNTITYTQRTYVCLCSSVPSFGCHSAGISASLGTQTGFVAWGKKGFGAVWCETEVMVEEEKEETETEVWVPVNDVMNTDGSPEVRVEDVAF